MIYVIDMVEMVKSAKVGVIITETQMISMLLFADNIIMSACSQGDLEKSKDKLTQWSAENRMTISIGKTQIVTEENILIHLETDKESHPIQQVDCYKYLGVKMYKTSLITSAKRSEEILQRANMYKRMLIHRKPTVPDAVKVFRALLENVAIAAILYGYESITYSEATIQQLDQIQRSYGKSLLVFNTSTANEIIEVELGMKLFHLQIVE